MAAPTWNTPAGSIGSVPLGTAFSFLFDAANATSYESISGTLPDGLSLSASGVLSGNISALIKEDTVYRFVVRAKNLSQISDRTFSLSVAGPAGPVWITAPGFLQVGSTGQYYIINEEFVDFQFSAISSNASIPDGQKIRYYLEDFTDNPRANTPNGVLPPGLELTEDGKLIGYVKDDLSIKYDGSLTGGFDDETFDNYPIDHVSLLPATYSPKIYQFFVNATDGIKDTRQQFIIKVLHPSNLRVDPGLITVDDIKFYTSDSAGNLVNPRWLTPVNFGSLRAKNKYSFDLSSYDPYPEYNTTYYEWVNVTEDILVQSAYNPLTDKGTSLVPMRNTNIGGSYSVTVTSSIAPQVGMYFQLRGRVNTATLRPDTVYRVLSVTNSSSNTYILGIGVDTRFIKGIKYLSNLPHNSTYIEHGDIYAFSGIDETNQIATGDYLVFSNIDDKFQDIGSASVPYIPYNLENTIPIGTYFYLGQKLDTPPGFILDKSGLLHIDIPYIPKFNTVYRFIISIVNIDKNTGEKAYNHFREFTVSIHGLLENNIQFTTDSDLGSIYASQRSELSVNAKHMSGNAAISYSLVDGELPVGLELRSDGTIIGNVGGNISGQYTFTVTASDTYNSNTDTKEFSISVLENSIDNFTKIYASPFFNNNTKNKFYGFITDSYIFDASLLYRSSDPEFGVQRQMKLFIEHSIQEASLDAFYAAMNQYFYKKVFALGNVKSIKAADKLGNHVYDLVYVEIKDLLINNNGQSIVGSIQEFNEIAYPNSVANWRYSFETIQVGSDTIQTNELLYPRFMNTIQDDGYPLGFILAVPLCYAKPGSGEFILNRINASGFDFSNINFEIDRLIIKQHVDSDPNNDIESFLIFNNNILQ